MYDRIGRAIAVVQPTELVEWSEREQTWGLMLKPPASERKPRTESRSLLLDATENIITTEGYAAVTTRRVASKVGLTPALVHYYFPTTDDLLLATYRRAVERWDRLIEEALASERPLHALWNLHADPRRAAIGTEFLAIANHRKGIRAEIAQHEENSRKLQAEALATLLADPKLSFTPTAPISIAMFFAAMSRAFVTDEVLGVSAGHSETRAMVEQWLKDAERGRRSSRKPRPIKATQAEA